MSKLGLGKYSSVLSAMSEAKRQLPRPLGRGLLNRPLRAGNNRLVDSSPSGLEMPASDCRFYGSTTWYNTESWLTRQIKAALKGGVSTRRSSDELLAGDAQDVRLGQLVEEAKCSLNDERCKRTVSAKGKCVTADDWNLLRPVGTKVRYFPIMGELGSLDTKTKSIAWALGDGHPVVLIEGVIGGVSLRHLQVLEGK